jgi:hypothetical protein
MKSSLGLVAVCSVLILLVSSGCTANNGYDQVDDGNRVVISSSEASEVIQVWLANKIAAYELWNVQERLERECMEQLGFEIHPTTHAWPVEEDEVLRVQFGIYAGPNPLEVDELGYGNAIPRFWDIEGVERESSAFSFLSEEVQDEYYETLLGTDLSSDQDSSERLVGGENGSTQLQYHTA